MTHSLGAQIDCHPVIHDVDHVNVCRSDRVIARSTSPVKHTHLHTTQKPFTNGMNIILLLAAAICLHEHERTHAPSQRLTACMQHTARGGLDVLCRRMALTRPKRGLFHAKHTISRIHYRTDYGEFCT